LAGPTAEERALAAQAEQAKLREWFVRWLEEEEARMRSQTLPLKKTVDDEAVIALIHISDSTHSLHSLEFV
jgi:hypothetical protein